MVKKHDIKKHDIKKPKLSNTTKMSKKLHSKDPKKVIIFNELNHSQKVKVNSYVLKKMVNDQRIHEMSEKLYDSYDKANVYPYYSEENNEIILRNRTSEERDEINNQILLKTKNTDEGLDQVKTLGQLPANAKVHKYDPDHNKDHGVPHVHLAGGEVLNIYDGLVYRKKEFVRKMKKKELLKIQLAVNKHIILTAQGKFNLDGNLVLIHLDVRDKLPNLFHAHTSNFTISTEGKKYNVGYSNKDLQLYHNNINLVPPNIEKKISYLYKNNLSPNKVDSSLKNKLNILMDCTNKARIYFQKNYNVDFLSTNISYF
jgi:hypothetical protein